MTPNPEAVRALLVASNFFAYGYAAGLDAPAAPAPLPHPPQTDPATNGSAQ